MAIWEWLGDTTWTHEVSRRFCVPPDGSTYGNVVDQDLKPPQQTYTFRGTGLTTLEVNNLIAAQTRGGTYAITDKHSVSKTGTVISIAAPEINGTNGLHTVTVQLRI